MKDKLLKLLNAKNELRSKLAAQARTTEDVKELRSINSHMEELNADIKGLEELIAEEEERERAQALEDKKKLEGQEARKSDNKQELRAIAKMLKGKELTEEERSLVTVSGNAAIMPEGFINQLELLRKGFPSLKPYCHVIPVTTNTGRMPVATLGNNKLVKLVSGQAISEGAKATTQISYAVEDYGKIIPVENSLTEDEVVGIIENIITPDFAEGAVLSENEEILKIIKDNATPVEGVTDYVGLENAIDGSLPSVKGGLITVTNITGYCYLKSQKDKEGRSLNLITTINGIDYFNGKPIVTLDDADLVSEEGKYTFYLSNLKELVKFFDRKTLEIATSKEALFDYNQTAVRAVERFDTVKGLDRSAKKIEIAKVV
ncbi:phage major capsid protein [Clostridium tertium]